MKTLLALCLFLWTSISFAGGVSSGGGNTIESTFHKRPVLLDLYLHDPQYEIPEDLKNLSLDSVTIKSFNSSMIKILGYDYLFPLKDSESEFSKAVSKKLQSWKQVAPKTVNILSLMLSKLLFRYIPYRYDFSGDYDVSQYPTIDESLIKIIAVYSKNAGPLYSGPAWNQLDAASKVGLLFHEALRQAQIRHSLPLTNKVIQYLTSVLVFESPEEYQKLIEQKSKPSLDNLMIPDEVTKILFDLTLTLDRLTPSNINELTYQTDLNITQFYEEGDADFSSEEEEKLAHEKKLALDAMWKKFKENHYILEP